MDAQELRNLQEAYMEVYECYSSEQLNEGLISRAKSIKKALKNKTQKPKGLSSRGIEVGATGVNKQGFDALRSGEPYRPSKKPQILGHGAYQAPKVGKVGGLLGGTGAAAYAGSQGSLGGSQESGGVIASLTPKGARKIKVIEPQSVVPPKTFDKGAKIVRDIQSGKYPKSKKAGELRKKLKKAGFKEGESSIPYKDLSRVNQKEDLDLYDIILSYLLDEGYAETQEAAEAIMVNMGEEWRENIVEVSDRKVKAVRNAREKQWNNQFGKNRVQDPTDDMVNKVDKLIDQRNKRTGSNVKKTTIGQLSDKYRKG
jgi:hypothetical protein